MGYSIRTVADEISNVLTSPESMAEYDYASSILSVPWLDFDLLRDFAVARDAEQESWSCKPALQAIDLLENADDVYAFSLQLKVLYGVLLWDRALMSEHWGSIFRATGYHRLDVKKLHHAATAPNWSAMACVFDDARLKYVVGLWILPGQAPSRLEHTDLTELVKALPWDVRVQFLPLINREVPARAWGFDSAVPISAEFEIGGSDDPNLR